MSYVITKEELSLLHSIELLLLDEIKRICKIHNISFFLDSGSALGAVRHGGFIPWDDDVDIGMLRNDYERFIKIAPKELKAAFVIQTYENDSAYQKYSAKLRLKGTTFPEDGSDNYISNGIAVDIFPFDNLGNSDKECVKRIHRARFMERVLRFRQNGKVYSKGVKRIIWLLLSIVPSEVLEKKYLSFCKKKNKDDALYVTCFFYRMLYKKDLFFLRSKMIPCKKFPFEDREYLIMNDTDYYLSKMYGNYLELPSEEERVCHVNGRIDFGDYESKKSI